MSRPENYSSQIGQVPYAPRPAFHQHPATSSTLPLPLPPPPLPPFRGPSVLQPQVIHQVDLSFQHNHRIPSYQHAAPGIPYQHPRAPVISSGMNSSQSYVSHFQPPQSHPSTEISKSYPALRPQQLSWGQNVRQFPAAAPHPRPNAYPVPSSQWHTPERHALNQPPPHAPSTPMPLDSSSSRHGSFMSFMPQHYNLQPMRPLPLPPLPRPSSTPVVVPPVPPSSPPSHIWPKNEGNHNVKDVKDVALMLEHQTSLNPAEVKNLRQTETPCALTEKNGQKLEPENAIGSCSPADSDMDMEDDITLPNMEKKNLSNDLDTCVSLSQEDDVEKKLQDFQLARGYKSPEVALREDILVGSEVTSDYDFSTPRKLSSEVDDPSMNISRQTKEDSLDCHAKEPSFQPHNFCKHPVPVHEESGYAFDGSLEMKGEKLLGDDINHPSIEDATTSTKEDSLDCHAKEPSFQPHNFCKPPVPVHEESGCAFDGSLEMKGEKLLGDDINHPSIGDATTNTKEDSLDCHAKEPSFQPHNFCKPPVPVHEESGYAFDGSLEMKGEKLLGDDINHPSIEDATTNTNAEKQCKFGSEVQLGNPSESNMHLLSMSNTQSTRSSLGADKLSQATGKPQEVSCEESVSVSASLDLQPKSSSENHNANIVIEGSNFQKRDMKSDYAKLNVDEFGRLVREGVSDSDTSDSPSMTRAKRARKSNRSRSRGRSPHDRRSPWRRKERRKRSRSWSPRRHRSRSGSPVSRHDYKLSGSEHRQVKGRILECFNFRRGKCYRGASCWFSHHESDQSEKVRHTTRQQQYQGSPFTSRSSDFHKSKVLPEKQVKDEQGIRHHGLPCFNEAKASEQTTVDSIEFSSEKLDNMESGPLPAATDVEQSKLSAKPADAMPSGKGHTSIPDSHSQYSDKIPEMVDRHGEMCDASVTSQTSSFMQEPATSSTHHPVDKPDGNHDRPTSELVASVTPMTKHYSTEEVLLQSVKELPSVMSTCPPPSISVVMTTQFAKLVPQDQSAVPPISHFSSNPENCSPYQAPLAYQQSHFPVTLSSLSSSFVSPSQPPNNHLPVRASGEHCSVSRDTQQSFAATTDGLSSYASVKHQITELPSQSRIDCQEYSSAHTPNSLIHASNGFESSRRYMSSLLGSQGGPTMGEERLTFYPVQSSNLLPSFSQARPNLSFVQSPMNRSYSFRGEGLPSGGNSSHGNPYLHHTAHGMQYSSIVTPQLSQPGNMSSYLQGSHPDVQDSMGSRIPYHFNTYASPFDLSRNSKFSLNTMIRETDVAVNTKFGAPAGLSLVPDDASKFAGLGSKSMISLSELPVEAVSQRPNGDQYDPLFDSIEPASTSLVRVDQTKLEATDDSDNMVGFRGPGRLSVVEAIKQDRGTAQSVNVSPGNEEYGETGDIDVEAFSNASLSNPNNYSTGMNGGDTEINQVKNSGKSKGKDSRSMKLFKSSIATFVKEVLKPSWRQGNMSKEAFKTIVKKTVDKVSGATRSKKKVPKSKANIDRYINSSRGKLTRLVMGYVDKYVKT